MAEANYPEGAGNVPGRRRRGALPVDSDQNGTPPAPPIGSTFTSEPAAPEPGDDGLTVTAKQQVPPSKVLGIRVSENHYDVGNTIIEVLATQFRLDKRQVGELIVQFLSKRRFELYDYVKAQTAAEPVDLDFFSRKPGMD